MNLLELRRRLLMAAKTSGGKNLFDIDNPLLVANTANILKYHSPKIENGVIYSGGTLGSTEGAYICIKTDKKSVYNISFNADFDETTQTTRYYRTVRFNDFTNGVFTSPSYGSQIVVNKGKNSFRISSYGYEYIGFASFSNARYGMAYTDFQIENITSKDVIKFDFSPISVQSFSQIGISNVTPNSVTITTTENVPSNNNGYIDSRTRLGALCPNLEVGKSYMLDFENSQAQYCSMIIYNSGATWSRGQAREITQTMLNSSVVFYGYNHANNGKTGDVVISNMTAREVFEPSPYKPFV